MRDKLEERKILFPLQEESWGWKKVTRRENKNFEIKVKHKYLLMLLMLLIFTLDEILQHLPRG